MPIGEQIGGSFTRRVSLIITTLDLKVMFYFAEDFRFNLEYLKYVKNISVMHEKGYLYRVDTEGSLSKRGGI